jgi:hypothetical protein
VEKELSVDHENRAQLALSSAMRRDGGTAESVLNRWRAPSKTGV